jgi:hypothetical protein
MELLSWSLQWAQGKLVCSVLLLLVGVEELPEGALPQAFPLAAPVQVQVALVPGSQVHLVDCPDLPDCSCSLDWFDSFRMYSLFPSKATLQADCKV